MTHPQALTAVTAATVGTFCHAIYDTYGPVQLDGTALIWCALDRPRIRAAVEAMLGGKATPGKIERLLKTHRIAAKWGTCVPDWHVTTMPAGWLVIHPAAIPLKGPVPFLHHDTPVRAAGGVH